MMKKKVLIPVVALLLCVGMVSVGFAAWVITTTTTGKADGQFTVYSVEARKVDLGVEVTDGDVVFGQPENYSKQNSDWLLFDSATEATQEDLSATVSLTIKNWKTDTDVGSALTGKYAFTVKLSAVEIQQNQVKTNAFDNYVVCPGALNITVDKSGNVTAENASGETVSTGIAFNKNTGVLTVDLTFAWGSAFNNKNPAVYYNGLDATESNISDANTALKKLHELDDADTYKYAFSIAADVVVQ